jgi:hypothetical protein
MGYFEGTYSDAKRLAHSLRSEFEGDSYNLLTKYVGFLNTMIVNAVSSRHGY